MAVLNPELATIARDIISEMREEGWTEDDIKYSASGAILKHCEETGIITTDWPTKEDMAAILALVLQVLKEHEPTLQQCPYCKAWHEPHLIESCPLNPKKPS